MHAKFAFSLLIAALLFALSCGSGNKSSSDNDAGPDASGTAPQTLSGLACQVQESLTNQLVWTNYKYLDDDLTIDRYAFFFSPLGEFEGYYYPPNSFNDQTYFGTYRIDDKGKIHVSYRAATMLDGASEWSDVSSEPFEMDMTLSGDSISFVDFLGKNQILTTRDTQDLGISSDYIWEPEEHDVFEDKLCTSKEYNDSFKFKWSPQIGGDCVEETLSNYWTLLNPRPFGGGIANTLSLGGSGFAWHVVIPHLGEATTASGLFNSDYTSNDVRGSYQLLDETTLQFTYEANAELGIPEGMVETYTVARSGNTLKLESDDKETQYLLVVEDEGDHVNPEQLSDGICLTKTIQGCDLSTILGEWQLTDYYRTNRSYEYSQGIGDLAYVAETQNPTIDFDRFVLGADAVAHFFKGDQLLFSANFKVIYHSYNLTAAALVFTSLSGFSDYNEHLFLLYAPNYARFIGGYFQKIANDTNPTSLSCEPVEGNGTPPAEEPPPPENPPPPSPPPPIFWPFPKGNPTLPKIGPAADNERIRDAMHQKINFPF